MIHKYETTREVYANNRFDGRKLKHYRMLDHVAKTYEKMVNEIR
jgi:exosome complex RNA-binding protein Rrp42 (RNase PH superfamily)